jgi:hypothetical protein
VTSRFSFTHDAAGITVMAGRLGAAGVAGVTIERGDGPVVEELLSAGLAVFVVPSRQINGLRTRYGSAGNKDGAGLPSRRRRAQRAAPTREGCTPGRVP